MIVQMRQLKNSKYLYIIISALEPIFDRRLHYTKYFAFVQTVEVKSVKEFPISLRSFAEVERFVSLATKQPYRVFVGSGKNRVNGKNIMGMFTLDFSAPVQVQVDCDDAEFQKFRKAAVQMI